MSQPTIGVRPAIFATGPTELASTGAGGPAGEPEQWTGFALHWPGCHIDHFPMPAAMEPPEVWESATRTPRRLRWTLRSRGHVVAEGWADVYKGAHDERNAPPGDFVIIDLGDAAPPMRGIEVTASDPERLPDVLRTLEVVPIIELIGVVAVPQPEPMPPGPSPDDD
jgi:hypothetical protein